MILKHYFYAGKTQPNNLGAYTEFSGIWQASVSISPSEVWNALVDKKKEELKAELTILTFIRVD